MIIVRLTGGLGNQMFQYAAAKQLSLRHSTCLKADLSDYEKNDLRKFELKCFPLVLPTATDHEIQKFKNFQNKKWFNRFLTFKNQSYLRQPNFFFRYYPEIEKANKDSYLDGYWQSEKYFRGIDSEIRNDFKFLPSTDTVNIELALKIAECNSVSVHIRRGDYVSNNVTSEFHGTCSPEYYSIAMQAASLKISNPVFFVFSDDPTWVMNQKYISGKNVVLVNHNKEDKSFEDMRLMSLCKNNIIANSSFSWWAAWLNENPGKLIFAPEKWFNPESKWFKQYNIDTSEILPSEWIKINDKKS
ncbi:MAG: alpha-1,2-fucosyltransferase [Bacteroidota bacterium]|nr:alpha-1,2-fucosyltransferase [Bacteroidota bacterium]